MSGQGSAQQASLDLGLTGGPGTLMCWAGDVYLVLDPDPTGSACEYLFRPDVTATVLLVGQCLYRSRDNHICRQHEEGHVSFKWPLLYATHPHERSGAWAKWNPSHIAYAHMDLWNGLGIFCETTKMLQYAALHKAWWNMPWDAGQEMQAPMIELLTTPPDSTLAKRRLQDLLAKFRKRKGGKPCRRSKNPESTLAREPQ